MGGAILRGSNLPTEIELAHALVEQAIALLDKAEAPADIAAHLDMARHRMASVIGLN